MATNRMEINETDLENINGGAFNYNPQADGTYKVVVDGVGTYTCKASDLGNIFGTVSVNDKKPAADVVAILLSKGLFY